MTIHQEVTINCSPERLYRALTTSDDFSKATGAPAEIEGSIGGAFTAFGGEVTGRQIELKDNELLVQAWRVGAWPEGVYSIVRMGLERSGKRTKLTLDHSGYPEGAEEHLAGGWHKMYWNPLKAFFE